jgi:hypothetical protein
MLVEKPGFHSDRSLKAKIGMVQSWSAATLQRGRPLGDDRRPFICAPPSVVRRPSSASVKQDDHDFEPCPKISIQPELKVTR